MRVVIQKVSHALVKVDGKIRGEIGKGFLLLVGVEKTDTEEDAQYVAGKIAKMRIFEDENQKMNLSLKDVGGEILSISQFTLFANTRKGNRPSFTDAARPEKGQALYGTVNDLLRREGYLVAEGVFGAQMEVALINDGPVTVLIDSRNK